MTYAILIICILVLVVFICILIIWKLSAEREHLRRDRDLAMKLAAEIRSRAIKAREELDARKEARVVLEGEASYIDAELELPPDPIQIKKISNAQSLDDFEFADEVSEE